MYTLSSRLALALILGLTVGAVPARAQGPGEPPRLPSIALPAELDRVLRDYARAWAAGDADALALLFTDDGHVSNAAGWVRGRPAIRSQYANAGGDLRLRALSYAIDGSVAWIIGAYGYGDAAAESDRGKFVLALRRGDDGRWLIAGDLDNANRRPGAD